MGYLLNLRESGMAASLNPEFGKRHNLDACFRLYFEADAGSLCRVNISPVQFHKPHFVDGSFFGAVIAVNQNFSFERQVVVTEENDAATCLLFKSVWVHDYHHGSVLPGYLLALIEEIRLLHTIKFRDIWCGAVYYYQIEALW